MDIKNIKWDEKGLIPAIIQDSKTLEIRMVGYMNLESINKSLNEKIVTFFSRSKKRLWTKGETSGNKLLIDEMSLDCDKDALLIKATPLGPTCHLGNDSCFDEPHDNKLVFTLEVLEKIIDQRKNEDKSDSYVSSLFNKGVKEISKKLTEEAGETSISAVTADGRVVEESADLLFHLLVLLNQQGTNLEAVIKEIEKRSSSAN